MSGHFMLDETWDNKGSILTNRKVFVLYSFKGLIIVTLLDVVCYFDLRLVFFFSNCDHINSRKLCDASIFEKLDRGSEYRGQSLFGWRAETLLCDGPCLRRILGKLLRL